MAKKTVVTVVDDIDGAELDDEYETVRWGIDGKHLEFDASPANAEAFRNHLATYVAASRSAEVKPQRRPRQAAGPSTRQVREWANANGYTVSDRGRIPIDVAAAYEAANN